MSISKTHRPIVHYAPAVILTISIVLGCLAEHGSRYKHRTGLMVSASGILVAAIIQPSPLALGAAGFFAGMALETLRTTVYRKIPAFGEGIFTLKGKVVKVRPSRYGQSVLTVRISEMLSVKRFPVNFDLIVNAPISARIIHGDEIIVRSPLKGEGFRGIRSVIKGIVSGDGWKHGGGKASLILRAQKRLKEAIRCLPDNPAARLLSAVSLGEKWRVDTRTRDILRKTGTYHIMAISGVHIGAAALPLLMILRFGTSVSQCIRPRGTRAVMMIMFVFSSCIYLCFTGLSASAIRASVYFCIVGMALLVGRRSFSMVSLSWCVLVIVCLGADRQPDLSLMLSALAVAGIILSGRGPNGRGGFFTGTARMTLGAFLFTLPAAVWLAGGISIITVIGNIVAGITFGLFFIPMAVLIDFVAIAPWFPLAPVIEIWVKAADPVLGFLAYLADLPFSFMCLSYGGCLAASFAAVTGIIFWHRKNYRPGAGLGIFMLVLAVSGIGNLTYEIYNHKSLMISFPAVGQADAAIIRQNGRTILIDCGPPGLPGRDSPVIRALRKFGVRKIDAIFISHFHPDHAGGLKDILTLWPVRAIYLPEQSNAQWLERGHLEKEFSSVPVRELLYGEVVQLSSMSFSVLGPHPAENPEKDMNRGSMQLLLEADGYGALFTGDAGWDQVVRVISSIPRLDLLKVPHHGSKTGFPPDGLDMAIAKLHKGAGFQAVFPSGRPGKRHLPAPEVVRWFAEKRIELVYIGDNSVNIRYKKERTIGTGCAVVDNLEWF